MHNGFVHVAMSLLSEACGDIVIGKFTFTLDRRKINYSKVSYGLV